MNRNRFRQLAGFYENELTNRFLSYWLPRCEDRENGGFVNCFDNSGAELVSRDKYCWSQGRFVWIFSKLASTKAPIFTAAQRAEFLRLAGQGVRFLMDHCLIGEDDWRCVFLLDEWGNPKRVEPYDRYDTSIYADCFVVAGLSMYALQTGDKEVYDFARKLYLSILKRVEDRQFETLPYPLSKGLRAHGIPMILSNISKDMYLASRRLEPEASGRYRANMTGFTADTLEHFMDGNGLIHEIITEGNQFFPQLLGNHINPGHSIEDAWFMYDSAELGGHPEWTEKIVRMVESTLEAGWDKEYGGILHFAALTGGEPAGDNTGYEEEPMSKQLSGWGDKLWWVHSEALYTTLRTYVKTGDERFLDWHEKIFNYVYHTFPNRDPEIREWEQIRDRTGAAKNEVVALPVKDPYHVMRNLILIIELLYGQLQEGERQ